MSCTFLHCLNNDHFYRFHMRLRKMIWCIVHSYQLNILYHISDQSIRLRNHLYMCHLCDKHWVQNNIYCNSRYNLDQKFQKCNQNIDHLPYCTIYFHHTCSNMYVRIVHRTFHLRRRNMDLFCCKLRNYLCKAFYSQCP